MLHFFNIVGNLAVPNVIRFLMWCSMFYIMCSPLAMWMYILYQFVEGWVITWLEKQRS